MTSTLIDFAITAEDRLIVVEAQRNGFLNQATDAQIQVTKLRDIVDKLSAELERYRDENKDKEVKAEAA